MLQFLGFVRFKPLVSLFDVIAGGLEEFLMFRYLLRGGLGDGGGHGPFYGGQLSLQFPLCGGI